MQIHQRPIQPKDVVVDNVDRCGIVISRCQRPPSRKWLDEQLDARMRKSNHAIWWNVMPLDGGLVIVPEDLLRFERVATFHDVLCAVGGGNEAAVKTLIAMFPELSDYAESLKDNSA